MKRWMLFLIAAVFTAVPALALAQGAVELPQTGQKLCYDALGAVIDCSAGQTQDGAVQDGVAWPEPRFTNNGDGTMTDNLTGLIWLRDANCFQYTDWESALNATNSLADPQCGLTDQSNPGDWRLPNVVEIESLVNLGYSEEDCAGSPCTTTPAAWLNIQGFINVQGGNYCSSTTAAFPTNYAWRVHMQFGTVYYWDKTLNTYFWPVRGPEDPSVSTISLPKTGQTYSDAPGDDGDLQRGIAWPDPRFQVTYCDDSGPCSDQSSDCDDGDADPSNDVVYDGLTDLTWARDANLPNNPKNWQGALDYVDSLNSGGGLCGQADWHLPNRKELFSLSDFSEIDPAIQEHHPFVDVPVQSHWSSTTYGGLPPFLWAWRVEMISGASSSGLKDDASNFYVWLVRSAIVAPPISSDISVLKSANPDPVAAGQELTYSISVANDGPDTAAGVTLTDTLPEEVLFISAFGCTHESGTVTCELGDMADGEEVEVTIEVEVSTIASGTITNVVDVASESEDPDMSDNSYSISTYVETSSEPSIEDTIDFFDQAVDDGTITGNGGWIWGQIQLNIMRRHLTRARDSIERGYIGAACWRLRRAYLGCDGVGYDWVVGEDAEELAQMIYDLAVSLDCWWT